MDYRKFESGFNTLAEHLKAEAEVNLTDIRDDRYAILCPTMAQEINDRGRYVMKPQAGASLAWHVFNEDEWLCEGYIDVELVIPYGDAGVLEDTNVHDAFFWYCKGHNDSFEEGKRKGWDNRTADIKKSIADLRARCRNFAVRAEVDRRRAGPSPRASGRTAGGRNGGSMGTDLEMRRRCRPARRGARRGAEARRWPAGGAGTDQEAARVRVDCPPCSDAR
jgi:hypothetical protein